jgi:glycosyltransferase involved in cell wall biosynthesis
MPDVSVITSAHSVADARLHRLTAALIRANIKVEVIALGDKKDAPKDSIFKPALGGKGFLSRILRDLLLPIQARGKVFIVLSPDLLPSAYLVAKMRNRKIVADIYEDYIQLLHDRPWAKSAMGLVGRIAKIVALVSTSTAARCDLTTVADTQVPPFIARKRLVVRNLPDLESLTPSGSMDEEPRAIYIGDLRASRGLQSMLRVAELSPGWKFDFVGSIAPQDQASVDNWNSLNSASKQVSFHGRQTLANSWQYAKGAWVGLSLLESTPAFEAAIPSKIYEYMAAGLATISSPLPRCVELLKRSQAGVTADSPEEVAAQLKTWQFAPAEIEIIRNQAQLWAAANLDGGGEYDSFANAVKLLICRR